jgi:hypothetical protein
VYPPARNERGKSKNLARTLYRLLFRGLHAPHPYGQQRLQETLDKHGPLEWLDRFFGPRKGVDFHGIPGMVNGGPGYDARLKRPDGQEELHSVTGVWVVDAQGQPAFPPEVVPTVVHEFTSSHTSARNNYLKSGFQILKVEEKAEPVFKGSP